MAENDKGIDYGAILADLEAKRTFLESAIASLKTAMAAGALGTTEGISYVNLAATVVNSSIHGGEVPAGAFLGKSIPEAAKLYLSIVKKKQSTREIAEALGEGGMETTGRGSFESIVSAALYRVRNAGDIVRVKGAWGLAEWWPAGVGSTQEQPKGRRLLKPRRGKTSRQKKADKPARAVSVLEAEPNGKGAEERIIEFLRSNANNTYSSQEVSKALNINSRGAAMTLGRLASKKLVEKVESGKYHAV